MLSALIKLVPDMFCLLCALFVHRVLWRWAAQSAFEHPTRRILEFSALIVSFALIFEFPFLRTVLPHSPILYWVRGAAICWAICLVGLCFAIRISRELERVARPERRQFLRLAQTALLAAPVAIIGYGVFLERRKLQLREIEIPIPGLPRDLDGFRIGQITDLHCSPFLSPSDVAYAVAQMNEAKPHLAVITGDLITGEGDPLDECIEELAKLRADAGVYGCLGNHEIYARCEDYVAWRSAQVGIRFLRGQNVSLPVGSARINLAGVDYQRMHEAYLVRGGDLLMNDGSLNLLLSHNPDAFHAAKLQGWDLMLAGHTHGGQVTVEYLEQHLNLARFFTKYVSGLYQENGKSLYVSRGLGTVGAPIRLGATPELTLVKLCAT